MKTNRLLVGAVLAIAVGAPIAGFLGDTTVSQPTTSPGVRVPFLHSLPVGQTADQSALASLERANAWLNSPPLTAEALRGKVVLVDFWTYTCINWRRTLPYVRAWAEKYRNQGLVVIGVHAPEFAFEKNVGNVRWAVADMRIGYPVAVDSEHLIWRAFNNQYWPALYFIDSRGRMRHHHFGEGGYEQSEMIIQELLAEAGNGAIDRELVSPKPQGAEADADWRNLKSPATERRPTFRRRQSRLRRIATGESSAPAAARPESAAWRNGRDPRRGHGDPTAHVPADPAAEPHRRPAVRDRVSRSGRGGFFIHVRLIPAAP